MYTILWILLGIFVVTAIIVICDICTNIAVWDGYEEYDEHYREQDN
jgi:hypothetical protein